MATKKTAVQDFSDLGDLEDEHVEEDGDIQQSKNPPPKKPRKVMENKDKPRSEAQVASLKKAHQSMKANAVARQKERQILIDEEKALMENKIIQKAIAIKKRAIKKRAILDEIPEDDTPIEEIKKIARKTPPSAPRPPKYVEPPCIMINWV